MGSDINLLLIPLVRTSHVATSGCMKDYRGCSPSRAAASRDISTLRREAEWWRAAGLLLLLPLLQELLGFVLQIVVHFTVLSQASCCLTLHTLPQWSHPHGFDWFSTICCWLPDLHLQLLTHNWKPLRALVTLRLICTVTTVIPLPPAFPEELEPWLKNDYWASYHHCNESRYITRVFKAVDHDPLLGLEFIWGVTTTFLKNGTWNRME